MKRVETPGGPGLTAWTLGSLRRVSCGFFFVFADEVGPYVVADPSLKHTHVESHEAGMLRSRAAAAIVAIE